MPAHQRTRLRATAFLTASGLGAWLLGAQFDSDAPNAFGAACLAIGAVGFGATVGAARAWLFALAWAALALALGVVSGYDQPAAGWRALMALIAGGPLALVAGAVVSRRARNRSYSSSASP